MRINNRTLRVAGYLTLLAAMLGSTAAVGSEEVDWVALSAGGHQPIWEEAMAGKVELLQLAESNQLIVGTSEELAALLPESGSVIWKNPEMKNVVWYGTLPSHNACVALSAREYEIELGRHQGKMNKIDNTLYLLDPVTGEVNWSSTHVGFASVFGKYLFPKNRGIMLYGRDSSDTEQMIAVDIASGRVLWKSDTFFGDNSPKLYKQPGSDLTLEGHQSPLFDTDSTMLVFMDKKGLRKYNIITGQPVWVTDLDVSEAPAIQEGYASTLMSADGGKMWVPCDRTLKAVNTIDGSIEWQIEGKLPRQIRHMQLTPRGLLISCGSYDDEKFKGGRLVMVDPESGAEIWNSGDAKIKNGADFALKGDTVIVYSGDRLLLFDLASGESKEVGKKIKLKDKVEPFELTKLDSGYRIAAKQEILLLDDTGGIVCHQHRKAPGTSGLLKVAGFMATMAIGMAFRMPIGTVGNTQYFLVPIVSFRYPRHGSTTDTDKNIYMVTDVECHPDCGGSDPGLVRVSKQDGSVTAAIILKDKTPIYDVDENAATLFFVRDEKTVTCTVF